MTGEAAPKGDSVEGSWKRWGGVTGEAAGVGWAWLGVPGGNKGPLGEAVEAEAVVGSGALCRAHAVADALLLTRTQWGVLVGDACRCRLSSEATSDM